MNEQFRKDKNKARVLEKLSTPCLTGGTTRPRRSFGRLHFQAEGHEVIAAQNSLDTLKGDVAAVHRALGRVSSPAVLVGHSYGGTVITAAGTDERVVGPVYICGARAGRRRDCRKASRTNFR